MQATQLATTDSALLSPANVTLSLLLSELACLNHTSASSCVAVPNPAPQSGGPLAQCEWCAASSLAALVSHQWPITCGMERHADTSLYDQLITVGNRRTCGLIAALDPTATFIGSCRGQNPPPDVGTNDNIGARASPCPGMQDRGSGRQRAGAPRVRSGGSVADQHHLRQLPDWASRHQQRPGPCVQPVCQFRGR